MTIMFFFFFASTFSKCLTNIISMKLASPSPIRLVAILRFVLSFNPNYLFFAKTIRYSLFSFFVKLFRLKSPLGIIGTIPNYFSNILDNLGRIQYIITSRSIRKNNLTLDRVTISGNKP